jgi:hypothetical protein
MSRILAPPQDHMGCLPAETRGNASAWRRPAFKRILSPLPTLFPYYLSSPFGSFPPSVILVLSLKPLIRVKGFHPLQWRLPGVLSTLLHQFYQITLGSWMHPLITCPAVRYEVFPQILSKFKPSFNCRPRHPVPRIRHTPDSISSVYLRRFATEYGKQSSTI